MKALVIFITLLFASLFIFGCTTGDESPETSDDGTFTLVSEAVVDGLLLEAYQCESKIDGSENSLPLSWSNAPEGTESFAVTMVHYPNADDLSTPNCYLVLWGIEAGVTEIAYGEGDDGPWYMGANKDGTGISYTSPCSPSTGSHEYTITISALSETPSSLPTSSSVDVDYSTLQSALESVTILETASITFDSVTP